MIAGAMNRYAALTSDPAFRLIPRPLLLSRTVGSRSEPVDPLQDAHNDSSRLLDGNVSNGLLFCDDAVS